MLFPFPPRRRVRLPGVVVLLLALGTTASGAAADLLEYEPNPIEIKGLVRGTARPLDITLRNKGDEEVSIRSMRASCPVCVRIKDPKPTSVPAGGKATIHTIIDSAGLKKRGRDYTHKKNISLVLRREGAEKYAIQYIRLEVEQIIPKGGVPQITPKGIRVFADRKETYRAKIGNVGPETLTLDKVDAPAGVTLGVPLSGGLTPLEGFTLRQGILLPFEITIDPETFDPGGDEALVTIHTDGDPALAEAKLTLHIAGGTGDAAGKESDPAPAPEGENGEDGEDGAEGTGEDAGSVNGDEAAAGDSEGADPKKTEAPSRYGDGADGDAEPAESAAESPSEETAERQPHALKVDPDSD